MVVAAVTLSNAPHRKGVRWPGLGEGLDVGANAKPFTFGIFNRFPTLKESEAWG